MTPASGTCNVVPTTHPRMRHDAASPQGRHSRVGFTLVELLVVIGIIALLISILLPALNAARSAAQLVKCEGNLRTLGQAMMMHANDHKGYYPLGGWIDVSGTDSLADNPSELGDASQQLYDYYENASYSLATSVVVSALPGSLAPYLGATGNNAAIFGYQAEDNYINSEPLRESFICPSDLITQNNFAVADGALASASTSPYTPYNADGSPVWVRCGTGGTYVNGWSSYAFNDEILGWQNIGTPAAAPVTGHSRERGKLSLIPHWTTTMLMCDFKAANHSGREGNTMGLWVNAVGGTLATVFLGTDSTGSATAGPGAFDLVRHHGRMNILYVDGHVDTEPILSTGNNVSSGAVGTANNSPNGALSNVSIDVDFP